MTVEELEKIAKTEGNDRLALWTIAKVLIEILKRMPV